MTTDLGGKPGAGVEALLLIHRLPSGPRECGWVGSRTSAASAPGFDLAAGKERSMKEIKEIELNTEGALGSSGVAFLD